MAEVVRSEQVVSDPGLDLEADRDVPQFLRAERRLAENYREQAARILEKSLLDGTLIFQGTPSPGAELGQTIEAAARTLLGRAAKDVFPQDLFSSAPYGWSKDAVRYLFAGLLVAGEIELHTPDGVVKTSGQPAIEAMKSTMTFKRIGVAKRDSKLAPEALDRAARRLEQLFGDEVLPLEDHVSRAVRRHLPDVLEQVGSLPDRLRLRDRLNSGRAFLGELRELREELLRIGALPYKPDLNDGVIINAAPFHGLFRLRSWAKDTEKVWNKLERGDYDWAHLTYVLWPDRVRDVCRKDRSIAIAHGLE